MLIESEWVILCLYSYAAVTALVGEGVGQMASAKGRKHQTNR